MGDFRLNDTCVDKCYTTLNGILEAVKYIDKGKVMSLAFEGGWTEEKVIKFILRIRSYHAKLKEEKYSLELFSKDFNKQWATDNNNCFTTVELIFSKIQETLKDSMRVFLSFSNKMQKKMLLVNGQRVQLPAYKTSRLGTMYCQKLIPFAEKDIVSPIVDDLCEAVLSFFVDVREVLLLCRKVIRQEAQIRKNPSKLAAIFEECYNDVISSSIITINTLKNLNEYQVTNPMVKELNETKDKGKFLADKFHTQTVPEWKDFVVQDAVYKARKEQLHPLEEIMWGKDWERIKKARLAIRYFDEMNPKGSINNKERKYKLKGKVVAMLMRWCGFTDEHKNKGNFMKYFNETYKGEYLPIRDTTVYEAYGASDDDYEKFEEQLNKLVEEKRKNGEKAA